MDRPLLDLTDPAIRRMIKLAKKRGYVTHDELNMVLPPEEFSWRRLGTCSASSLRWRSMWSRQGRMRTAWSPRSLPTLILRLPGPTVMIDVFPEDMQEPHLGLNSSTSSRPLAAVERQATPDQNSL
jgi:hypothetical protein